MERKEVLHSDKFKEICNLFGLNWLNFNIVNNAILVSNNNLLFIFDGNYNIFGIYEPKFYNENISEEAIVKHYYDIYSNVDSSLNTVLPYPFQHLSIKDIIDIADRIEIMSCNNGHSTFPLVNGKEISKEESHDFKDLLMYTKFLGEEIKDYYEKLYEAKMLGVEFPNIYSYLRTVVKAMNTSVNKEIEAGNLTSFINNAGSLDNLGRLHTPENLENKLMLSAIRVIHADKYYKLEQSDPEKTDPDYFPNMTKKLLEIPKYPKELIGIDFGTKYSSDGNNGIKIKTKSSPDEK